MPVIVAKCHQLHGIWTELEAIWSHWERQRWRFRGKRWGSVNPFVLAQQSCSEVFLLLDKKFQTCEGSGPLTHWLSGFQLQHVGNMLQSLQLNFPFLPFPAHVISRLHAFAILCRCHGVPLRFVPKALQGLLFHPMQSDFTTCLTPKQLDAFLERAAPNRFTYIVRSPEWAAGTLLVFKSLQTAIFYHSACRRYTWTWKDLKRPAYGGKVTFSIGNLINLHFQNLPDSPEMENIGNFTFQDLSSSDKIDVPPMVPAPTTSKPSKPTQPPAVAPVVKDSGVCWWIGRIGRIILRCLENSWDILAWGQWIQWLVQQTLREATLQYGCSVRWLIKLVGFRPAPLKTIQIHYGVQVGKPVNP